MQVFANNALSTLNGAINLGATTLIVADGSTFPSTSHFWVRLGSDTSNEVVRCTARSGNTITCDATASSWTNGVTVANVICAESLNEFKQKTTLLAHGASGATHAIDVMAGEKQSITISEACSLTFTGWPTTYHEIVLDITNGGAYTITWAAAVEFPASTQPSWTASGRDKCRVSSGDAGTTVDVEAIGLNYG